MSGLGGDINDDGSMQAMIMVENAVELARMQLPLTTVSRKYCLECAEEIPIERRHALPGVTHCLYCRELIDKQKFRIRVVDHIL